MRLAKLETRFARDERGVAALEMALTLGIVSGALVNGAEVGRYIYTSAEIVAATQAGAQAAVSVCDATKIPATTNCAALNAAVTGAVHGGTLGATLALHGPLTEAWYCVNASGALQNVGAADAHPANCTAAGDPAGVPALYLRVQTEFTYHPMFPGMTVVDTFPQTILRSAWMRMS